MDNNVKERLQRDIGAKLVGAPDSPAKSELIEELAQNLLARYEDLVASGVDSETAYRTAMDDLGDTAELVEYLNSLGPEESIPNPEDQKQDPNFFYTNFSSNPGWNSFMSNLDGLMSSVGTVINEAFETAKTAMKNAQVTISDIGEQAKQPGGYTYYSPKGNVSVTVHNNGEEPETPPWQAELEQLLQEKEDALRKNLEEHGITGDEAEELIQASLESARPKLEAELKQKWGSHKGTPKFTSDTATVDFQEDGNMSVDGVLHTIDVEVSGDIEITENPDFRETDVVIGGDVDKLSIVSQNGVLTIRNSNSTVNDFMRRRGWQNPTVELSLPQHNWTSIRAVSVNGDVSLGLLAEAERVELSSVSGDVEGHISDVKHLKLTSVSGDVDFDTNAENANCSSVSGDVHLRGDYGDLKASSVSGDVNIAGSTGSISCSTASGDILLETSLLPGAMNMNTKSGDIDVTMPDEGPFTVEFRSMSGEFTSEFFEGIMAGKHGRFKYGQGDGPVYRMQSFSGNLNLDMP